MGNASKVPADANMSAEVRDFLDTTVKTADQAAIDLAAAIAALPALDSQAEAEAGTDNVKYMSALRVAQAIAAQVTNPFLDYLHVRDEKATNAPGGTFTQGADQTRTLNTSVTNTLSGASLAVGPPSQITLPAGTYSIKATAPAVLVNGHRIWLYDTTGVATLILGSSDYAAFATPSTAHLVGQFTLSVQSVLELRHRGAATRNTDGFGMPANHNSAVEVYASVEIWKVS